MQIRCVDPPAQRQLLETQALQLPTALAIASASFQPPAQTAGHRAARNTPALIFGSPKAGDGASHAELSRHTAAWGTHTWLL